MCCGYEDFGNELRLYLDSPMPKPSISRERGVRTKLFHLFAGEDAEAIRSWLARNKAWQVLRVPQDYTTDRGIRAIRIAYQWRSGKGSPFYLFASTRRIHGQEHRDRLRAEVRGCIGAVIENPVHRHELTDLQLLKEVIDTAPMNVQLATFQEVWPQ